jgi:hypothetical protein|tara:strand:+ start:3265 stop:3855 length:591 start_codon:yes stop_codon:yes gene_type:complete
MINENEVFDRYKINEIYKSLTKQVPIFFCDPYLSPANALKILQQKLRDSNSFKESLPLVQDVLNQSGVLKYREQYRQYKYRCKNKLRNLKVREETYNKVKVLAKDFDGIDDLLFEYAFDKRYYMDTSKIDNLPTSLTKDEQLTVALESIDYRLKDLLNMALQEAYKKGFMLGQETKKIRSKVKMEEAITSLYYVRF